MSERTRTIRQSYIEMEHKMRVLDMHAHLYCLEQGICSGMNDKELLLQIEKELIWRKNHGVLTFYSSGTPKEWSLLEAARSTLGQKKEKEDGNVWMRRSFGIHPWYSDQYEPNDSIELFQTCDAVGEIGMDSLWCTVPLKKQREIFVKQLEIAAAFHKPVILHTKDQEEEIAGLIRDFPGKICVHWYSGNRKTLELFLELNCYFTLGPDGNPDIIANVPLERLFLETDGIGAIDWAGGEMTERETNPEFQKIPSVLEENLSRTAQVKGIPAEIVREKMFHNLCEFLNETSGCF